MKPSRAISIVEPLVVFDWGVLRGWPRNEPVPPGISMIVPETALLELVGMVRDNPTAPVRLRKNSEQLEGLATKFGALIKQNAPRFWIGRYWDEISRGEYDPMVVLRLEHVVNTEISPAVQPDLVEPEQWYGEVLRMIEDRALAEHEQRKKVFTDWVNERFAWLMEHEQALIRSLCTDREQLRSWIQSPELMVHLLPVLRPKGSPILAGMLCCVGSLTISRRQDGHASSRGTPFSAR